MAFSRLYETAFLGPLAEQLVDAAGVGAGMHVLDVGAGRGVLTTRCARVAGSAGSVMCVAASEGEAHALRDELSAARVTAGVVAARFDALPFADGEFDAALSLFGVAAARGGEAALTELARVATTAVAITRAELPPAPEELRERAWQETAGFVPPAARSAPPLAAPAGWTSVPLRDVVRFDSARQLWDALTPGGWGRAPAYVVDTVRDRYCELLSPYEGADGTLRIPVTVMLVRCGPHSAR